jgi:hypothetical protein
MPAGGSLLHQPALSAAGPCRHWLPSMQVHWHVEGCDVLASQRHPLLLVTLAGRLFLSPGTPLILPPGLLLPDSEASQMQVELLRAKPTGTMSAALACSREDRRRAPCPFVFCTSGGGGGAVHMCDFSAGGCCLMTLAWDLADAPHAGGVDMGGCRPCCAVLCCAVLC